MGNPRAWAFIAVGDERQYAGNSGYLDEPRKLYRYDSNVGNHKNVSPGDVAVLRSRDVVFGIARIESVDKRQGTKEMRRCPECAITSLRPRRNKTPRYRCDNGHVFETPRIEMADVILYEAHYGASFVDAPGAVSVDTLKSAAPRPADQASIEELDIAFLEPSFLKSYPASAAIFAAYHESTGLDSDASADDEVFSEELISAIRSNAFAGSFAGGRKSVLSAIRLRRGPDLFRDSLLERYQSTCVVTGCRVIDVLEAAHIWPSVGPENDDPSNGLLLRSDVHTLFDLHLTGIEPHTLAIRLAPALLSDYAVLEGSRIRLPNNLRPASAALKARWKIFESRWIV